MEEEGLQNFMIKVFSPFDPASPFYIMCKKNIEVYSIKDCWAKGGGNVLLC